MSKRTHDSEPIAGVRVKREPTSPPANINLELPPREPSTSTPDLLKSSVLREEPNDRIHLETNNDNNNNNIIDNDTNHNDSDSDSDSLGDLDSSISDISNDFPNEPQAANLPLYDTFRVPQNQQDYEADPDSNEPQYLFHRVPMPAFISKTAKKYIAYQDKLARPDITSDCLLSKITNYLEIHNLVKFRLVNKAWKKMIDRRENWMVVKLGQGTKINDWDRFVAKLEKHETYELVFDQFTPTTSASSIIDVFYRRRMMRFIRYLTIKTITGPQNKFGIELACAFRPPIPDANFMPGCIIKWEIEAILDPESNSGMEMVRVLCQKQPLPKIENKLFEQPNKILYCYSKLPEMTGNPQKTVWVELDEIDELFNGGKRDIVNRSNDHGVLKVKTIPI